MNDRWKDLPALAPLEEDDDDENDDGDGDIETIMAEPVPQPNHILELEVFFREVELIKRDVERVTAAAEQMAQLNEEALKATTTEEERVVSNKLRPLIDETNKLAKKTKTQLTVVLEEERKKLQADEGIIKPTYLRIPETMCHTLTRKFMDEIKAYQTAQQKYKNDIQKKVAEEIADAIIIFRMMRASKEGGGQQDDDDALSYRETVLAGGGGVKDQVKTTYSNILAGKYQEDVLALEHSVAELHQQVFLDFVFLTQQQQGELLDQIEYYARSVDDYVEVVNMQEFDGYHFELRRSWRWHLKRRILEAYTNTILLPHDVWVGFRRLRKNRVLPL